MAKPWMYNWLTFNRLNSALSAIVNWPLNCAPFIVPPFMVDAFRVPVNVPEPFIYTPFELHLKTSVFPDISLKFVVLSSHAKLDEVPPLELTFAVIAFAFCVILEERVPSAAVALVTSAVMLFAVCVICDCMLCVSVFVVYVAATVVWICVALCVILESVCTFV